MQNLSNIQKYYVKQGETLTDIAKRFNCRPIDIVKSSNLPKGLSCIQEGMILHIEPKFEKLSYIC